MNGTVMKAKKVWLTLLGLGICAGSCVLIWMWRPAIAPIAPVEKFDDAQILRGAKVVEAGDCAVCHTPPGGKYLAGGLPLVTPFGTLYSTNITPDMETGIGNWSYPAFRRAMREGIARDGQYLYPAFPYVHYRRMTDGDINDAYAYLMSGPPVHSPSKQNQMSFPMNISHWCSFGTYYFFMATPSRQSLRSQTHGIEGDTWLKAQVTARRAIRPLTYSALKNPAN